MASALPLPSNSCTTTWRDPTTTNGRLMSDVRIHPQGGLCERCDDDCDDVGRGLSVCVCNDPGVENPPSATVTGTDGTITTIPFDNPLRRSADGCLWVKTSLGQRYKKTVSTKVAQPTASAPGTITPIGTPETVTITNDTPETVCYEMCVDICDAFIDCPQGTDPTVTIDQIVQQISGDSETVTIQPTGTITRTGKAGAGMRITFNNKTCTVFAADNTYNAYSGRVCLGDITVQPGATFTSDLVTDLIGKGTVTSGFTASTGEMCVTLTRVSCPEMDC